MPSHLVMIGAFVGLGGALISLSVGGIKGFTLFFGGLISGAILNAPWAWKEK